MEVETAAQVAARVSSLADEGYLADALNAVADFVLTIIRDQLSHGRVFSSPDLDRACLRLGAVTSDETTLEEGNSLVLIATEIAPIGGHTRVLMDIGLGHTEGARHVLLTNIANRPVAEGVVDQFKAKGFVLEIAPEGNPAEKLRWMQWRLAKLRPARTYLLIHPFDSVGVASAQQRLSGKLFYIHNNDHALALGVHIPHAVHIDLHMKGYCHCRRGEGLKSNRLWPIVAEDRGPLTMRFTDIRRPLTTCTSGGFEKFSFGHLRRRVRYLYSYPKIVPKILRVTGGQHIHIGPLEDGTLAEIKAGIAQAGLPQDHFVHIPVVPDLWEALLKIGPDVYIGSFPLGGGRATVEAMGAGLPLLIHDNYRSIFLSVVQEVYEGAMVWRNEGEFLQHLRELTPEALLDHGKRSRAYYEAHHMPEFLKDVILGNGTAPEPVPPIDRSNLLQSFLDETAAPSNSAIHEETATHALNLAEEAHQVLRKLNEDSSEYRRAIRRLQAEVETIASSLVKPPSAAASPIQDQQAVCAWVGQRPRDEG